MSCQSRARTPEAKDQRGREILNAAVGLFEKKPYKDISMAEVARRSGVAKGTVFLYFPTKEELFLAMAKEMFDSFFRDMEARLTDLAVRDNRTVPGFISVLEDCFRDRDAFLKIIPLLGVIIEHNISYDTARDFKQFLSENIIKAGDSVERMFPFFKKGDGRKVFLWFYGIVIGFQNLAFPAPVAADVIEKEDMEIFRFDFREQFFQIVKVILNGLI